MAPFNSLCRFLVSHPRFSKQFAFSVQKFQLLPVATVNHNVKITKAFCSTSSPKPEKKEVSVTFLRQNGERLSAKGKIGDSLLDIVVNNEVDIDGYGACEGTLACSTCHVLLTEEDFDGLPEPPTDEELDMLDLAYGLTPTSRLGCQIIMSKELDGLTVKLPEGIADARGGN